MALQRIEQNNADIAACRPGAYGRPITTHLISAEVPLGYLLNFRRSSFVRAVDLGVRDTRAWCARHGIRTQPVPPQPVPPPLVPPGPVPPGPAVRFHEVMKGQLTVGETACESTAGMVLDLDVVIRDLDAFLADPGHTAEVSGSVRCAAFGGGCRFAPAGSAC